MDSRRFALGFAGGMVATILMSIPMIIGTVMGVSPMPQPIPAAIVGTVFGEGMPQPLLLLLAALAHLAYGGFWGGVLAVLVQPVTVWKGIGLGLFLWLIMQLVVLPFLGWGPFGTAITPMIAGATLVLHLIYGAAVGWLVDMRGVAPRRAAHS